MKDRNLESTKVHPTDDVDKDGVHQVIFTMKDNDQDLLTFIRKNVIGKDAVFSGPFGDRKVIYCDWTASGKSLKFIEDFMEQYVYPFYSNTHTSSTTCATQTAAFRKDAKAIIRESVNASDDDVVIFAGSGTTGAVHKLIHAMQIHGDKAKDTAVLVGPYEHHSNILPWKESGAQVHRIRERTHGKVDMDYLEAKLIEYGAQGYQLIVAFSAASNVTGILTDTTPVSELAHKYGAICIWDYATGAPYLQMDMNPTELGYKDAIICSPHKFVGGPGTPGLLIAKKHLFTNPVPSQTGGGTVSFVTNKIHMYVDDIEEREEGGTPAITESIRAGLIFQLKRAVGERLIESQEDKYCRLAMRAWKKNPNIIVMGSHTAHRLPIFSLLFRNQETGKFLHHNFIATLLNDLYGIHGRGGCACAGPYAQELLGLEEEVAQKFTIFLGRNNDSSKQGEDEEDEDMGVVGVMKPGFLRLNFAFFLDEETVDFIIHAVDMVATHGWKLLPLYKYDATSGEWEHRVRGQVKVNSLHSISYAIGELTFNGTKSLSSTGDVSLETVSTQAEKYFRHAANQCKNLDLDGLEDTLPVPDRHRHLVWFMEPRSALLLLMTPALKFVPLPHTPLPFKARRKPLVAIQARFRRAILKAAKNGQIPQRVSYQHPDELSVKTLKNSYQVNGDGDYVIYNNQSTSNHNNSNGNHGNDSDEDSDCPVVGDDADDDDSSQTTSCNRNRFTSQACTIL